MPFPVHQSQNGTAVLTALQIASLIEIFPGVSQSMDRALEQVPNSDIQADTAGKAHPSSSGNRILANLTDCPAVRTLEA
jgi:hypothetical protein